MGDHLHKGRKCSDCKKVVITEKTTYWRMPNKYGKRYLNSICKKCLRIRTYKWNKKHPEKNKIYVDRWQKKNSEKMKEYSKRAYKRMMKDPIKHAKFRKYQNEYRRTHPRKR